MTEKRACNLRSGGSEAVTVPVQFEVSDENFMLRLLQCHQNTSLSGQVSDSDSGSENNSSMSDVDSDNEKTPGSKSTGVDKQVPSSSSTCRDSNAENVSQQAINVQILSQLGDISKRLNAIENKNPRNVLIIRKLKTKVQRKLSGLIPQSHCLPIRLLLNLFQIYNILEVMHISRHKSSSG